MRIFHVKWPTPKHRENSLRGIRYAARHGYTHIDLDLLITRDNVIVGCHWQRPMVHDKFYDPAGIIHRGMRIKSLNWAQVRTLRAGRGLRRYRIQRVERLLAECARRGIVAYLEPKDDKRFEEDWPWQHIAAVADDVGAHVMVRAIRDFPTTDAGVRRVKAARRNGFEAKVIR